VSAYKAITDHDLISWFQMPLEQGKYILAPDGKIWSAEEYSGKPKLAFDWNWHYVNNPPDASCEWLHDICSLFNFIPTRCLGCWKVVVRPNTLQQLFSLQGLMLEMVAQDPTCYCKCGTEARPYVFGNYGGYFYQTSKEAMQERYLQVRDLVHEKIHPTVKVIPKRYCSEYEKDFGPSDKYEQPEYAAHWEKEIADGCHIVPFEEIQPDLAIRKVMREWIKFAWSIGDPTVYLYTEGAALIAPPVTYYPEENK